MFAIFRWTNISPGSRSRMVVSGTRESLHPIHRIWGCCALASDGKRAGRRAESRCDQALLRESNELMLSPSVKRKMPFGMILVNCDRRGKGKMKEQLTWIVAHVLLREGVGFG